MWILIPSLAAAAFAALWLSTRRRLHQSLRHSATLDQQISQLTQQERQTLAHERAQREAIIHSMIEGVLLLDPSGHIQLVNPALEQLFGLESDVRGRTLIEAFRLHHLDELVNRVRIEGQVQGVDLLLPHLDNRCLQVNAATLLHRDGQPGGIILVFHDQTRLIQLENTRREFVANVSHELRTPLSLIKGSVETLLDGAQLDPQARNRFLQMIDKHADRLTFLIEDLLTISRLESGQVQMTFTHTELHPLVQRVLDDLAARAQTRNVHLHNTVPPTLIVRADTDRLQQVLFNLVDNAIKYGRPAGNVTVHASRLEHLVQAQVTDDGPGIPPDAAERVFERFYRVDRARSREQGGTGLGLAIVKHIVQSHGGDVAVQSTPGSGTTFSFTLPDHSS